MDVMLTYDEAIAILCKTVSALPCEVLPIGRAAGRYLTQPVFAAIDSPRQNAAAMDGYAVRLDDAADGQWLTVAGESAAGRPFAGSLEPMQAVRIFTGAHLPHDADCVIMQEYAQRDGDRVRFSEGFGPARHVRMRGNDFRKGDRLLQPGQRLAPGAMIALAGADLAEIEVARQPKIVVIATGDELSEPGSARLSACHIPESGSYGVAAMAKGWGATVVDCLQERDDLDLLIPLAQDALARADCVVVIGGASVGDHDLARPMFRPARLEEKFSRLAIRPGKPVWFGMAGKTPVLGLPGNPTSALVTARLFLAPLLTALQGGDPRSAIGFQPQVLCGTLPPNTARESFVRARSTREGLCPAPNQDSGAQAPLATSDWLIRRPIGAPAVGHGEIVPAIPF